ncbi:Ubiquitin-like domain superfamily [Sesbania bispinosa]|nr:Ubiquitin-like domain superfamily [Sesbania bispinosa]
MTMAKLKIAGTWSGVLEEVELEGWTIATLREEVSKRSNCAPHSINLICAGKILKDGDGTQNLVQLGIKNNSKILATRVSDQQQGNSFLAEEERSRRLARVRAAVTAMAERHADGSLPVEDFNIEVEDQSGKKVNLGSETDQRAVMMGLMLHAKGKRLIRQGNYKDALEVLSMGEESFSLCDPKVIETDFSDFVHRHLRLELLEGVVAYHTGQLEKSREALASARAKFVQLQVPDEALSLVMSMGFNERDAKRALRMNNQMLGFLITFLQRAKVVWGDTLKKAVDLERLKELVSIG